METKCVVVGIGNPHLQDDRAGIVVVKQLQQQHLSCQAEVAYSAGFEVLDIIRGFERAIIVDACLLGYEPGSILEVGMDDIFTSHSLVDSHAIPLDTTLKTGYLCYPEEMPTYIRILLIEVKDMKEFTQKMSPEVETAVAKVVERITELIATTA